MSSTEKTMSSNIFIIFFYLIFSTCNGDPSTWTYLSDFDAIYNSIGLGGQHSTYILDSSDYCSINTSHFGQPNEVLRVVCPNENKCLISKYKPPLSTSVSVISDKSNILVSQLWKDCTYSNGEKLFKNETSWREQLDSTITELVLSNNDFMKFPPIYFCKLPNLTSLDLSNNQLDDFNKLGVSTESKTSGQCCGCQLKELVLNKNNFKTISDDSFCGLPLLVILRMSNCGIQRLDNLPLLCLDNVQYIDFSSNNLTELPVSVFNFTSKLEILFLSNNRLNSASLAALAVLPKLHQLYLDKNQIEAVEANVLHSLIYLKVLNLRENRLTRLMNHQFFNLIRLRELDLSFNSIIEVNEHALKKGRDLITLDLSENSLEKIATGAFDDCYNLATLKLSNNNLTTVPIEINKLLKLKNLYMDRNRIASLNSSNFVNVTNLVNLDLSVNNLTTLTTGIFEKLQQLKTLKLNENQLTHLGDSFVNISVKNLYLIGNRLTKFSFSDFSPNVILLYLSDNEITEWNLTDIHAQQHAKNLLKRVVLDLSCNRLTKLDRIKFPNSLVNFNLRKNQLQSISYDDDFVKEIEDAFVELENVYLQQNKFETICRSWLPNLKIKHYFAQNPLQCSCENKWLADLIPDGNIIKDQFSLRCTPTLKRPGISVTPMILKSVDLDNYLCPSQSDTNQCKCESIKNCSIVCPDKCRCYSDGISRPNVVIDCGYLNTSEIPNSSIDYSKITTSVILFLDGNDFSAISSANLSSYTNVIKLYLNQSNISMIDPNTFNKLTKLQELHLNNNKIRNLPGDIFLPLQNLDKIDISSNYLSDYTSILHLDEISHLNYTGLRDNPWSCNCTFLKKFNSFLSNVSTISQIDRIYCVFTNGTRAHQPISKYYFQNCEKIITTNNTITYIWGSLLGIFVCITIVALVIFYFRHEMQVLFYSHYGVRIFNRSKNRTAEDEGKIYDAFIAYSSDDDDFLVHRLLPGLEQIERPYRLCLHQRDFAPGAFITDSILEAVERSSRTIIVLTENFAKSEWCKFEFKTAHIQMLHDRCARVIVVVVGDIPPNLDPEMRLYLKTNTYLKWNEKLFWEKLYFALPEQGEVRETFDLTHKV